MREETRIYQIYTFEELTPEVQERVLEQFRDVNVLDDWWWCVFADWTERLGGMGFQDVKIDFSGFWSQGDGASFTAKSVDVVAFMECLAMETSAYEATVKYLQYQIMAKRGGFQNISIDRTSHRYCHSNTCVVTIDTYYDPPTAQKHAASVESYIHGAYQRACYGIYKDLQELYEQQTSDEAIRDYVIDNEFEFLANGTIWR